MGWIKKNKTCVIKWICCLFAVPLLGWLLITLMYCLPDEKMRENAGESAAVFDTDNLWKPIFPAFLGSRTDMYTDSIMVSTAVMETESPIEDAMNNKSSTALNGQWAPGKSLAAYLRGNTAQISYRNYNWYWHGYLLYLKPLLLLFNYEQIILLVMLLFGILTGILVMLLAQRAGIEYAVAFGIALLFMSPLNIGNNLQFFTVFLIAFLGMLFMLCNHEWLKRKNRYLFFFLLLGMLTSYMDFLTAPLITLCFPLIVWHALKGKSGEKNNLPGALLYSVDWGIGYVGMWSGKWVIGSMVLQENILAQAAKKIGQHTGTEIPGGRTDFIHAFKNNAQVYRIPFFITVLVLLGCFSLLIFLICRQSLKRHILHNGTLALIMLYPPAWYAVANGHTCIHYWMTYRTFGIFFFAFLSLVLTLPGEYLHAMGRKNKKVVSGMKKYNGKMLSGKHREGIAYLFFGGLSTLVSWGSYAVFALLFSMLDYPMSMFGIQVSAMVLLSNILSWVCAVVFAFITNKLWVFESKSWEPAVFLPEAGKFLSARSVTGIAEIVLVPLLVEMGMNQMIFGMKGMVAKIVVTILVVLLNYVFSKLFIFTQKETVQQ